MGRNSIYSLLSTKSSGVDRYTLRGLVFAGLNGLGLGYELFFVQSSRLFLIVMYSLGIVISVGLIFLVNEKNVDV